MSIEASLLLVQTSCLIGIFQTLNLFKTKSFNKKNVETSAKNVPSDPKSWIAYFLKKSFTHFYFLNLGIVD